MPLNQHIERTIKQKLTKPADELQRNLGDLLFRVARLFPLANISGNRANGCVPRLCCGRKEKIFARLARLGLKLDMREFVTLQMIC